jgi:hypothetical protein
MGRSKQVKFQQAAVITAVVVALIGTWFVFQVRHRAAHASIECVRGWQSDVVLSEGRLAREATICEEVGKRDDHPWIAIALMALLGYVAGGFGFSVGYSTALREGLAGKTTTTT